jgi:hypothetical protein
LFRGHSFEQLIQARVAGKGILAKAGSVQIPGEAHQFRTRLRATRYFI